VIDNCHRDAKLLLTDRPGSVNSADGDVFICKVTSNFDPQYFPGDGVTQPEAPSNLTAKTVNNGQIDLDWKDNSKSETSFRIQRKTAAESDWSTLTTVTANVTSYSDMGLSPSTAYDYRVRAENSYVYSGYSNSASASGGAGSR
jgi:hypothetical protein